jgi:hypothetical protein
MVIELRSSSGEGFVVQMPVMRTHPVPGRFQVAAHGRHHDAMVHLAMVTPMTRRLARPILTVFKHRLNAYVRWALSYSSCSGSMTLSS